MPAAHVVSERKIEANRQNAQHSTGPRTDAGKVRSSRNAVTHGIYCRDLVLPGESQAEFEALRAGLASDLRPRGAIEAGIVEQVLAALWKLRRVRAAERAMFERHARAEHQEAYDAAAEKLREWDELVQDWVRPRPKKQVHGPPPPPPPLFDPERVTAAQSLAAVVACDGYDKLAKLEERLNRQVHRGLRELRLLRKDAIERGDAPAADDEHDVDESAGQDERNEPTGDGTDVPESAAGASNVRNEPTGDGEPIADAPVSVPEAPVATAAMASGGA